MGRDRESPSSSQWLTASTPHKTAFRASHATFDWNYINDEVQISKFIDPILDGSQLQVSSVSLLSDFAYSVPQIYFDNNNLKLRAKSE